MIIFQKLRYKNFLSSGNNWTEFKLDEAKHTLIVGHNGAGKSTMLDALSFALFGKAHRNINKPQLVNSINKKKCLVEVEFQIGKTQYRIVRGMNPGVFEIWQNGEMINQSSHNKEYQRTLENNILKLNHKSFHQIVVLGSSSFIPFMELPQGHRRDVIEDLLDINVFSKMNMLLRERNSVLKEKIKDISHDIDITETKRESQKKYIRDLNKLNTEHRKEKKDQIEDLQAQIEELQAEADKKVKRIERIRPTIEKGLKKHQQLKQEILEESGHVQSEIKSVVKEAKFYETNDICPSCSQNIDNEIKTHALKCAKSKAKSLSTRKEELSTRYAEIEQILSELGEASIQIDRLQEEVNESISTVRHHQRSISKLESELAKLSSSSGDLGTAKSDLESFEEKRTSLIEEKLKLSEEYSYNTVMAEMLKDTGIKTKVIKQYVPVINKLVNQYLQVLDFFVSFNLDEQFQEEIKSRHRDSFSYASFSEGEKQRIDLALLFTWRQIAKMKNSVSTNLLILDETFDSSLDADGVENLMKILYTLDDNTNVFIISHKGEILEGRFEKKISFHKEKNFSVMVKS